MASESKRREVLQLLREWASFHAPYGGAIAPEDSHLRTASYGPAGYIEAGMEYPPGVRARLKESYRLLDHAITLRKRNPKGMFQYLLLRPVFFGDPADPAIADRWREVGDYRWSQLIEFVEGLAEDLEEHNLFVVWPERMARREEKLIEKRNDEFYAEYLQVKSEMLKEGLSERSANRKAIEVARTRHGYGESRAYEIVKVRSQGQGRGNGGDEAA